METRPTAKNIYASNTESAELIIKYIKHVTKVI